MIDRQRRRAAIVLLAIAATNCDYQFSLTGPTIANNNTNTNTNDNDIHDLIHFAPLPTPPGNGSPGGPGETPLPIPAGAQPLAAEVARLHPALVRHSCQDVFGEAAWQFLDKVVGALASSDPRWGYLCKYGDCAQMSRDVIGYRATADERGAWGVDIISGHCGTAPAFSWNVLGYDPNSLWRATR